LLRVDGVHFVGRYAEEGRIEGVRILVEEIPEPSVCAPMEASIGMVESVHIESGSGNLRDKVPG
jgi:hypothetical protein